MKAHKLAKYFPELEGEEFDKLVQDIKENGQIEPIVVYDSQILDGLNRYRACQKLGIEPLTKEFKGDDPLSYVISINIRRRHMTTSQRAMLATEMLPEFEKEAKERQSGTLVPNKELIIDSEGTARSSDQVAAEFGISGKSVRRAKRIKEQKPERVENIIKGRETVRTVEDEIKKEKEKERKDRAIAEGRTDKLQLQIKLEEQVYINALEKFLTIVPKNPPKDWTENGLNKARALANLIIKRLEVFNG